MFCPNCGHNFFGGPAPHPVPPGPNFCPVAACGVRRPLNGGWLATAPAAPPNWPVNGMGVAQPPGGGLPPWDVVPAPAPGGAPPAGGPAPVLPPPAAAAAANAPGAAANAAVGPGGANAAVNVTPTPPAPPTRWWVILLIGIAVLAFLAFGVWTVSKLAAGGPGGPDAGPTDAGRPAPPTDAGTPAPAPAPPGPTPWVPGTAPPTGWSAPTSDLRLAAGAFTQSTAEGPQASAASGTYWCAVGGVVCDDLRIAPADAGGGLFCRISASRCIVRQ